MTSIFELFPGHQPLPDTLIKQIWQDAIVVFDTNIILNLYRYSSKTRNELFDVMEKMEAKVWLPYQVIVEYMNGRIEAISSQSKSYTEISNEIEKIHKTLSDTKRHPFITDKTLRSFEKVIRLLENELSLSKKALDKLIAEDDILVKVNTLTSGKIGQEYSEDEYKEIFDDGAKRYGQSIPPGYRDIKKGGDKSDFLSQRSRYGDLIIWKSVIKKAQDESANVIFVSDDLKDDWWLIVGGKTLGPQPQLIAEFKKETEKDILIYDGLQFLKFASTELNITISEQSLREVEEQVTEQIEHTIDSLEAPQQAVLETAQELGMMRGFAAGQRFAEFKAGRISWDDFKAGRISWDDFNAGSLWDDFNASDKLSIANHLTATERLRGPRWNSHRMHALKIRALKEASQRQRESNSNQDDDNGSEGDNDNSEDKK